MGVVMNTRRLVLLVVTLHLILSQSACKKEAQADISVAPLLVDFSCGEPQAVSKKLVKQYDHPYKGALTVEALAQGLSEVTGFDFLVTAYEPVDDDGIVIYWGNDASLIKGLDNRTQKAEFYFTDDLTLRWFMLDSMKLTLIKNFKFAKVYYAAEDGGPLALDLNAPLFTPSEAYLGSEYYFSHMEQTVVASENPTSHDTWVTIEQLPVETTVVDTGVHSDDSAYYTQKVNEDLTIITERLTKTNRTEADIVEYIAKTHNLDPAKLVISRQAQLSAKYTYPVYRVDYSMGEGASTIMYHDLYIKADRWDYRIHVGVSKSVHTKYLTSIEAWFYNLNFSTSDMAFGGFLSWWGRYKNENGELVITNVTATSFDYTFTLTNGKVLSGFATIWENEANSENITFALLGSSIIVSQQNPVEGVHVENRAIYEGDYQRLIEK
jgi:hypothetical protein